MVLEILSRSNTLEVVAVKDYVIKWLDAQKKQVGEFGDCMISLTELFFTKD